MLEAINLQKSYRISNNVLKVLKGVHLKIADGEIISVIGPSGAGKSTLLHILGGLDRPDDGQVILEEDNVYSLDDAARARIRNKKIGFIFQFYHLLPEFTAFENVMLPGLIANDSQRVEKLQKRRGRC